MFCAWRGKIRSFKSGGLNSSAAVHIDVQIIQFLPPFFSTRIWSSPRQVTKFLGNQRERGPYIGHLSMTFNNINPALACADASVCVYL